MFRRIFKCTSAHTLMFNFIISIFVRFLLQFINIHRNYIVADDAAVKCSNITNFSFVPTCQHDGVPKTEYFRSQSTKFMAKIFRIWIARSHRRYRAVTGIHVHFALSTVWNACYHWIAHDCFGCTIVCWANGWCCLQFEPRASSEYGIHTMYVVMRVCEIKTLVRKCRHCRRRNDSFHRHLARNWILDCDTKCCCCCSVYYRAKHSMCINVYR